MRYAVKNTNLAIYSCGDTEAVTMSSSELNLYMLISSGCYMQGLTLMGGNVFAISICDKLGTASGIGGRMRLFG